MKFESGNIGSTLVRILAVFVFAIRIVPADAATPVRIGDSVALSVPGQPVARQPKIARAADGRFVAVWNDGESRLEARVFDANGTPLTPALPLFDYPASQVFGGNNPTSVVIDAAGNFTVAWTINAAGTGGARAVMTRRYAVDGTPLSPIVTVDSASDAYCFGPVDLAMNAAGRYVVLWRRSQIRAGASGSPQSCYGPREVLLRAQSYSAAGATQSPVSTIYQLADINTSFQYGCIPNFACAVIGDLERVRLPGAVAIDSAGNFVVTWRLLRDFSFAVAQTVFGGPPGIDPPGQSTVYTQRFRANGQRSGLATTVANTQDSYNSSTAPDTAALPDGGSATAWIDRAGLPGSTTSGVLVRRYGPSGVAQDLAPIMVGGIETYSLSDPSVAANASGVIAVAWEDFYGSDGQAGRLRFRVVGADGTPLGQPVVVDGLSFGDNPVVAVDAAGRSVVAYDDFYNGASFELFTSP